MHHADAPIESGHKINLNLSDLRSVEVKKCTNLEVQFDLFKDDDHVVLSGHCKFIVVSSLLASHPPFILAAIVNGR